MVEFSNINPNESGLSVRSKLNKMLRELISGVEGVNSIWNEILSLDGITDDIRSDLTAWYTELRTQILYGYDYTDKVSGDLKSYINGMDGGVSAFADSTVYDPQFPIGKAATVLATQPGTYVNFKDDTGNPITITDENAVTIFYKGADSDFWKHHSIKVESDVSQVVTQQRFSASVINGKYWNTTGNLTNGTAHTASNLISVAPGRRYKVMSPLSLVVQFNNEEFVSILAGDALRFSEFTTGENVNAVGLDVQYNPMQEVIYILDITDIDSLKYDVDLSEHYLRYLAYGKYIVTDGGINTILPNPPHRGTERLNVTPGQFWRINAARYYVLYDADGTTIQTLTKFPSNQIIEIPEKASQMAIDTAPIDGIEGIIVQNVTDIEQIKIKVESDVSFTQWKGKNWFCFGTSISDTSPWSGHEEPSGQYPPFLSALSGLVHHNWAVKGSMLTNGDDDPERNSILKQIRIAAGLEADSEGVTKNWLVDADLITIEGLVNDWAHSSNLAPIGSLDDMTDTAATDNTIYGALYLAIKYCYNANPNATVLLITDSTGKDNVAFNQKNGIGKFQSDYAKVMIDAAQHMGCICIDAGNMSQINIFHPAYLIDHIHHSKMGGQQFANAIWASLRLIMPSEKLN